MTPAAIQPGWVSEWEPSLTPALHYLRGTFYFSLHGKARPLGGNLIIFSNLANDDNTNDYKCLLTGFAYINTHNSYHNPLVT